MKKAFLMVAVLSMLVMAADTPKLPREPELELIAAFSRALLWQNAAQEAKKTLDDTNAKVKEYADEYNALVEKVRKAQKLPKGTTFQVDVSAGKVTVVPPAPEKPAEKK